MLYICKPISKKVSDLDQLKQIKYLFSNLNIYVEFKMQKPEQPTYLS